MTFREFLKQTHDEIVAVGQDHEGDDVFYTKLGRMAYFKGGPYGLVVVDMPVVEMPKNAK